MKTEVRTVMVPKEKALWVADDGTTFEKKCDCVDYELEVYRKQLGDSKDVIECKKARDRSPFDGGEYLEGNNYRWFKPLNENGVELLNKAFPSSYAKLGDNSVDNWHCVEYTYGNECWWSELSYSERYANELLELLKPEQYGRSGYATELCPNCDTVLEMNWAGYELEFICEFAKQSDLEVELAQRQLRSLWTAYCFHKNIDCDTRRYDEDLAAVWDAVYENSTQPWKDNDEEMAVGFDQFDNFMCEEVV